jgi:guanylate kinase
MPEGIYIFLTPPDLTNLRERLVGRGTDSQEVIEKRVTAAREELKQMINYDYAVENDQVIHAVERIKAIITAERLRVACVFEKTL